MEKLKSSGIRVQWAISFLAWELRRGFRWISTQLESAYWLILVGGCLILFFGVWHILTAAPQQASMSPVTLPQVNQLDVSENQDSIALKAFDATLIPNDQIPETIDELINEAQTFQLALLNASYESTVDKEGGFRRLFVTFSIRGRSEKVIGFITSILRKQHALALVSANVSRKQVQERDVDAKIQFVLFISHPIESLEQGHLKSVLRRESTP